MVQLMDWLLLVMMGVGLNGIGGVLRRYVLKGEDVLAYSLLFNVLSAVFMIPIVLMEPLVLPTTLEPWLRAMRPA